MKILSIGIAYIILAMINFYMAVEISIAINNKSKTPFIDSTYGPKNSVYHDVLHKETYENY